MAAVSHGARHLRQGIGVHNVSTKQPSRSIHIPAFTPRQSSTAQHIFSETRTFFSRLISHATSFSLSHSQVAVPTQPSLFHPVQFSYSQSINARFSLPVKHALSRPFSPPRLPKSPSVPSNVTQVGFGTARQFHSGRPIFQNMIDNVPIATRALWEAEWEVKMKKKDARRMRRATRNEAILKSQEMLKPKPELITTQPQYDASELDVYFPVEPTSAVTTHLLVPLAPTPSARFPLSTRSEGDNVHPLLPISDLVSLHTSHRLHSLRVSTLFARLDAANVWDDPGVNVDAYAFLPRLHDAREKECTVLRVTFRGWDVSRVRDILGNTTEEWYSLEETHLDGRPVLVPLPDSRQDMTTNTRPESPSRESVGADLSRTSDGEVDDGCDLLSLPPFKARASAHHDLVLPSLDFSVFSDATDNVPLPPQPIMLLRTVSELANDPEQGERMSSSTSIAPNSSPVPSPPSDNSWEYLGLSSSFLKRTGETHTEEAGMDM